MQKEEHSEQTDKQLKSTSSLYYGLLILTVVLPIIFTISGYFLTGKTYFNTIHFVVIMIFLLLSKKRFIIIKTKRYKIQVKTSVIVHCGKDKEVKSLILKLPTGARFPRVPILI
jgi:membrane protein YdbS with pleckstrin-like domain